MTAHSPTRARRGDRATARELATLSVLGTGRVLWLALRHRQRMTPAVLVILVCPLPYASTWGWSALALYAGCAVVFIGWQLAGLLIAQAEPGGKRMLLLHSGPHGLASLSARLQVANGDQVYPGRT